MTKEIKQPQQQQVVKSIEKSLQNWKGKRKISINIL